MPNLNYKRGADKERKLVNKARKEGKIAFRSAGSHSPIDIVIVDYSSKHIILAQCKHSMKLRGAIPPELKEKLENEWKPNIDGTYSVEFKAL